MKRAMALLAACTLAGCATRQPGPVEVYPQPSRPTRPLPGATNPATYVAQAASIDLFVVRAAELAQLRSTDPRLRNAANELKTGHEGLASQLSFAGRRLNLLPGATMLPQQEAMYDELAASTDFDRTFKRLLLAVHGTALSLHSSYAARGGSPTLRPVAANAAAVERGHLALLRGL